MMNYGYDGMMGGSIGIFGPLIGIIVLIDLIFLGIWLWQHISKK